MKMAATMPADYMSYQRIPRRYHSREKNNFSIIKKNLVSHKCMAIQNEQLDF